MTIAGSDSGGGAGLQADLRTFAALGVFATCAVTAVTAQNTAEVRAVHVVDPELVRTQIRTVTDDITLSSVKTGMLACAGTVAAVGALATAGALPNLVVDPVLVASTGRRLLDDDGIEAYRATLLPRAAVVTPNTREATVLTGIVIDGVDDMVAAARHIVAGGAAAAVVKGGHLAGDRAPDVLVVGDDVHVIDSPRIASGNDHGSGCTLSAAIAAHLARGADVLDAVTEAKAFVHRALEGSATWRLGSGHGPLDQLGWGAAGSS
jgi:hydroxymethylpyrimidine/phosphomethylpyrimidine kinase